MLPDFGGTRCPRADARATLDPSYLAVPALSAPAVPSRRGRDRRGDHAVEQMLALQDWFRSEFVYDEDVDYSRVARRARRVPGRADGASASSSPRPSRFRPVAGMPSRVAVGFTPGDPVPSSRRGRRPRRTAGEVQFVVRGRHAHAWPEVYLRRHRLGAVRAHSPTRQPAGRAVHRRRRPSRRTPPPEQAATTTSTTAAPHRDRQPSVDPEGGWMRSASSPRTPAQVEASAATALPPSDSSGSPLRRCGAAVTAGSCSTSPSSVRSEDRHDAVVAVAWSDAVEALAWSGSARPSETPTEFARRADAELARAVRWPDWH